MTCSTCEIEKPLEEFWRGKRQCKTCMNARQRTYREANRDKAVKHARKYQIRRQYGMTVEEYDERMIGPCESCGDDVRRKVMDHDHETGDPRGRLCDKCNAGIGFFDDDPDKLLAAAAYLLTRQKVDA